MSDTETTNAEQKKVNWPAIISDMVVIMATMAVLAYLCNLLMKPFESVSPTDSLVSLVRKGANTPGKGDPTFLKELAEGLKDNPEFINTQDNTGRTPLMWAAYANFNDPLLAAKKDLERVYYVRTLLDTPGVSIAMTDKDGFTALHWAAWSGMPICSLLLADAGIDINAQDHNGYTPLMLAAMRGNDEVEQILLALGANTELTNAEGKTAAQLVATAEGAYNKRASWMYTLIFSENREESYRETMKLQQAQPAPATAAGLMAKLATPEALDARAARLKAEEKAQQEAAADGLPSDTPELEKESAGTDPV